MPLARHLLVDRSVPGIYHCISRCVRRAFLCGGEFEHRKDWVRCRLQQLTAVFAIDVGGYAIMDNHLHVVLRTNPGAAAEWSAVEVARRWFGLFPQSIRRWGRVRHMGHPETRSPTVTSRGQCHDDEDERAIQAVAADASCIADLRARLSDLSWFMKCLKEPIARRANREDGCTGHFWEGRFKSPRILDIPALLACLVYVDLNVIRAMRATTPEESAHTSIWDRIRHRQCSARHAGHGNSESHRAMVPPPGTASADPSRAPSSALWLAPIDDRSDLRGLLPMSDEEYLVVVDLTGRMVREDKPGTMPPDLPNIFVRLGIDAAQWVDAHRAAQGPIGTAIGSAANRAAEAGRRGVRRVVGWLDVYAAPPRPT